MSVSTKKGEKPVTKPKHKPERKHMKNIKLNRAKFAVEIVENLYGTQVNQIAIAECNGELTAIIKTDDCDITIVQATTAGRVTTTYLQKEEIAALKSLI
jgi:hypothetical protein